VSGAVVHHLFRPGWFPALATAATYAGAAYFYLAFDISPRGTLVGVLALTGAVPGDLTVCRDSRSGHGSGASDATGRWLHVRLRSRPREDAQWRCQDRTIRLSTEGMAPTSSRTCTSVSWVVASRRPPVSSAAPMAGKHSGSARDCYRSIVRFSGTSRAFLTFPASVSDASTRYRRDIRRGVGTRLGRGSVRWRV
jgi:hypothetical protein